jgi:hypothetical protein
VRRTGDTGVPTLLSPRQKLTSTPYAIRSLSAVTADNATNATQLGGTTADQFVLTGDVRLSDARPPTAGSGNYIQNGTASQPSSNFNVNGTGKADTFDANTQFNLGGARVLSNSGTSNLFAGQNSGQANTSGNRNSFFGYSSGNTNTTGDVNSFFGNSAGQFNTVGRFNDFFGDSSGLFNTTGNFNSFFGSQSGNQNTTGSNNTFVGNYAGQTNTTGNGNTTLGFFTNVLGNNLTNATAIGANARVDASNSLVLGSINGVNGATADTNVGIGTTTPTSRLHVVGDGLITGNLTVNGNLNAAFGPGNPNYIQNSTAPQTISNFNISGTGTAAIFDAGTQFNIAGTRVLSNAGTNNFFGGQGAGQANTSGFGNSFFGNNAGGANDAGNSNSFFGNSAGLVNTSGSFNAFFGSGSGRANVDGNNNAFFGYTSGRANASGSNNSFFGNAAGFSNIDSSNNAFFGFNSGHNVTGVNGGLNSFFGVNSGAATSAGFQNSFFGYGAGSQNTGGSSNTVIGYSTDLGSGSLFNATAIGAQAFVTQSNSLVLGSINGVNGANADTNVGIGTTAPTSKLHVVGDGLFTGNLTVNGSLNATVATANNALQLGGVVANQYVQTSDSRLIDARPPTPGSSNYIQNSTTQQTTSNFNITGDGTSGGTLSGNVVNSNTTINIASIPVFTVNGGPGAFANANTLVGAGAGKNTVPTGAPSGLGNSFFGFNAGFSNVSGSGNSLFGNQVAVNMTGDDNSFFGTLAGQLTTSGTFNTFVGTLAGTSNRTEDNNTIIGARADNASGVTNGTAIGFRAKVTQSNSLVLGSINGVNGATADTNVGIGTTAPTSKLHVVGDGLFTGDLTVNGNVNGNLSLNNINANTQYNLGGLRIIANPGTNNFFAGQGTGQSLTTGTKNAFFGALAGTLNTSGQQNSFFGSESGNQNSTGVGNSFFGAQAGKQNTGGNANSFFGGNAGLNNTTGGDNSYFGVNAGASGTSGSFNAFFGELAGLSNNTSFNSFFGYGAGQFTTSGAFNTFFGQNTGNSNTTGQKNAFFGLQAGAFSNGSNNAFMGTGAGGHNQSGNGDTALGDTADVASGALNNATAIGSRALVSASNSLVLGSINGMNGATADTNVGIGTTAPTARLHVVGDGLFTGNLTVNGTLNTSGATLSSSIVNATTQFNLGGNRVVSVSGSQNSNTIVGVQAGNSDPTGSSNSFFGYKAGFSTTISGANSFFGESAGSTNQNGGANSFFGYHAGSANLSGSNNTFMGFSAGGNNTGGGGNSFFGLGAGASNTSGNTNTAVGDQADVASGNLTNATAIGAYAQVSQSNSLVLGGISGLNNCNAPNCSDTNVGIGTTAPATRLHVVSAQNPAVTVETNSTGFAETQYVAGNYIWRTGVGGSAVSNGAANKYYIYDINAGQFRLAIDTAGNVGIGTTGPEQMLHVNGQVLSTGAQGGFKFRDPDTNQDWTWHASITNSDTYARLSFNGNDFIKVYPFGGGFVYVPDLNVASLDNSGNESVCRNALGNLATCSSSLRYKTHLAPFSPGLNFIRQLRPISFDWKQGGMHDIGFGAEEVAKINPLFVTYNKEGQVEGVKYDRLSTVFVNAFKEQQTQIEQQEEQITKQQTQIDQLKKLVCADHPGAEICKQ